MEEDIGPFTTPSKGNNDGILRLRHSSRLLSLAGSQESSGRVSNSSDIPGNKNQNTSAVELSARSLRFGSIGSSIHGDIGKQRFY